MSSKFPVRPENKCKVFKDKEKSDLLFTFGRAILLDSSSDARDPDCSTSLTPESDGLGGCEPKH